MKRFYKFLMPLVAIVALALPVNVVAQSDCPDGLITVANSETSTTTTSYAPGYSTYNYSVSEVLVPATALEGLGSEVFSMQFKPSSTSAGTYFNNCEVYLANSLLGDLSAGWVQDTSLHLVFSGSLNYTTTDWQTITFDSTFYYTGGSIIVLVRRGHGTWSSGSSFEAYNTGVTSMRYAYQDSGPYTIGSLTGTNTSTTAPLYKFTGCYQPVACAHVYGVTVSDIDSASVTISWVDTLNSGASYTVYNVNDSIEVNGITDTFYTFNNLTANTVYTFIVSAECGSDLSSGTAVSARTACAPIHSLPFTMDFNSCPTGSSTMFDPCWSSFNTYSATAYYPYVTSGYLYMYLYSSSGLAGQYGYTMMPMLGDDVIDDDLELTFDIWKSSTSGYGSGVIVALFRGGVYDASHPIDTLAIIIPTATTQAMAETQYVLVPSDSLQGKRLGFLYCNQDPNASGNYYYTYIDNVDLHVAPTCSHVVNLEVAATTTGAAYVRWNPGPAGNYNGAVVEYRDTTVSTSWTTINTTETHVVINGLTPASEYEVRVAAVCDGNDQSLYEYTTFMTSDFGCFEADTTQAFSDTIGNGTGTSTYLPSYSFYNYGLTQQIFTAAEIGHGGQINNFSFMMSTVSQQRTYEIYMGHTTQATATDFLHPDDLTLVYNGGPVTLTANQWTTFNLTTPFNYNGSDNLVIILRDMTGSYVSGNAGYTHSAPSGAARYVYQDSGPYDPFTYSGGTSLSVRNNIILGGAPCAVQATCAAPAAWVNGLAKDSVYLEWIPGAQETSWDVYYELGDSLVYVGNSTNTNYEVGGLTPSTDYTFHVVSLCGVEEVGTTVSFTTLPDDAYDVLPFVCTFDSLDGIWMRAGDGQANKWYIGTVDGNRVLMISSDNGATNTYNISSTSASHAYARLVLPAGEYGYSFDWKAGGESSLDYLLAYIVPDSYVPVAGSYSIPANAIRIDGGSYLNMQPSSWQTQSDVITILDSGVYKIVFTWRNDGSLGTQPPAVIDNLMLSLNTCPRPASITIDSVTTTSVTFHWVDNSPSTVGGYKVEYNGVVDYTMSTNYTAVGLTPATRYNIRVYSICADSDTSMALSTSVYTECAPITTLPYVEDFDTWGSGTSVHAPLCWTYGSTYSTTYPYISTTSYSGGSMYMYLYNSTAGDASSATWFGLPELDPSVASVNQTQVVFKAYTSTSSYVHNIVIGVGNQPTFISDSIDWLDTVTAHYDVWEEHEVPLDSYTGTGRYIFFKAILGPSYSYCYPYIDDLTLELIPTCQRPDSLYAINATSTTIDMGWHDRAGASMWEIEYGPEGFTPGTGTLVIANSNPFTVTGLPVAFQGEFRVRAICSSTDTGEFSRNMCGFATSQIAATLPYNYDFENAAEWNNWQVSSNDAHVNWYRGTNVADSGSYSIYVASSDSTYFSYSFSSVVNAAAYRDVDFGPIDSSYTLSFRARAGGTLTNYYDGLMVFLVDPSLPTTPSTSGITSPWGNVNNLYRIATMRLDTTWHTYEASFDTIHGVHRVAFFWFNQNTGASYTNIPQAAAVDNIHIHYSTCPRPVDLEAIATTSNSATLTWTGEAGANYEVVYRQDGSANQFAYATTNSITLTGLNSAATHHAWVRKICGVGDTSLYSDGTEFSTQLCDGANVIATGDPALTTSTTYNVPVNNFYNYTLSEVIIDSAELGGPMEISTIAYYYDYTTASSVKDNVTIWLQPTTKTEFTSTTDIDVLDTNTAVLVYTGSLNCSQGWNYFAFTQNYTYDGTTNLMVIVDDNSGDYDGSSYVFKSMATTEYKSISYYSDSYNPDPTTSSFSGSTVRYQYRPVMQLISCGGGCPAPVVSAITHDYASATITVVGNDLGYEMTYGTDPSNLGNPMSNATGVFNITGLTPATQYFYSITQVCDSGVVSNATVGNFITDSLPCFEPTDLAVANVTFNSAELSWTSGGSATSWVVSITGAGVTTYDTVSTNPYTITGLYADQEYSVMVLAVCGNGTVESGWSQPTTFTTDVCTPVRGVAVNDVTSSSAKVTWNPVNGTQGYKVYYGDPGFPDQEAIGTADVNATTTEYTITGLTASTVYEVFVLNRCSETLYSNITADDRVQFTTSNTGIYDVESGTLTLFPNPASEQVTLTVTGFEGEVMVEIVDMNGRRVASYTTNDNMLTVNVSELAQGAYFVRVTGDSQTAVRKLIVK